MGQLYNHGLMGECVLHECLGRLLGHGSDPALMLATQLMLVSGPLMEEGGPNVSCVCVCVCVCEVGWTPPQDLSYLTADHYKLGFK